MRRIVLVPAALFGLGVIAVWVLLLVRPGEPRLAPASPTPQQTYSCPERVGPTGDYCYPAAYQRGDGILPRSTGARAGESYRLEVGHCGLMWIVDFDGSFWRVVRWDTATPPQSLISSDVGLIQLTEPNTAVYTGSQGERVVLERMVGPLAPPMCA